MAGAQKPLFDDGPQPVTDDRQPWAQLSSCGRYRWALGRPILPPQHAAGVMLFIMLNPSTADASQDDPTINRCRGFAMREAVTELVVCNLSAWRATKPADLWENYLPHWWKRQGENSRHIKRRMQRATTIVVAWGANGDRPEFNDIIASIRLNADRLKKPLLCLGTTKTGQPRHPLYIPADLPFTEWKG